MYKNFFKLARNPFEISPDPHFLYPTPWHNEALAGLYYGIKARKGFLVLSGEVGTGKSLIVRCLLDLLDRNGVAYAYVFNSLLSSQEFLHYVAGDLGVNYQADSKSNLLMQLSLHLMGRTRQGLCTVLVVDEAQLLSTAVLEEIRLLTNLETRHGKLLQIILVGQPELDVKLESYELRQLKQRIALRFQLRPLSEQQTQSYIERRLRLAGSNIPGIFSPQASHHVFAYSRGFPRLINIICDNAMISAYAQGQLRVTPKIVDEVAADIHLDWSPRNHTGIANAASESGNEKSKDNGGSDGVLNADLKDPSVVLTSSRSEEKSESNI